MTTILLADDKRSVRDFCKWELEDEGYHVILARNGAEAVGWASSEPLDVVILDICMPGMDGLEAIQRIRALQPRVPVIFFTSFDEACLDDERAGYATACVEKSADLAELKGAVAAALRSRCERRPFRLGLPPAEGPARQQKLA
jgi:two-component system OmpR family response regulator